jgi:hypothetical protein
LEKSLVASISRIALVLTVAWKCNFEAGTDCVDRLGALVIMTGD